MQCREQGVHTCLVFFFFNDTAPTEIYTLSLHDALPISASSCCGSWWKRTRRRTPAASETSTAYSRGLCPQPTRSEEHTSELQSQSNLVCRLLLEKKTIDDPLVVAP